MTKKSGLVAGSRCGAVPTPIAARRAQRSGKMSATSAYLVIPMSYQVLARKYRPRSFETLVGQEHVVRALTHALQSQRLHHAYLFTGTRGVGKTTLSRILAKSLNCETGITAQPCGVCATCRAIDAGNFVDYIEMDAASNRGVDEMAQLLEQAVYAPSNARFKVYMIDEVHMLTNHAFNAMLKTLEEPPEHIKFILATTDPQKIPVTVLSRCLQFNLKQMPLSHIIGHLEHILGQEDIDFELPALRLLAQGAQGSMRDALSLTDQAIAYAAGTVTLEAVQAMLGSLDQSYLIRLLDCLAAQDGAGLLAIADEMAMRSLSYPVALQDLGSLLHRIAIAQTVPSALPQDLPERAEIMRLASGFDLEEVQLFYQIVVHGRHELGLAPDDYAGFSMTLLRLLAFRPEHAAQPGAAVAPAASSTAPTRAAGGLNPARAALEAARNGGKVAAPAVMAAPALQEPAAPSPAVLPIADPPIADQSTAQACIVDNARAVVAPPAAPLPDLNWDGHWPALAKILPVRGVVQQLALQSELIGCENNQGVIQFHLRVALETLLSSGSANKLMAALSKHFGQPIRVIADVGAVSHTAHQQATAEHQVRQHQAEQTMRSDPFVQTLMREFGATIVPGSIKPV